MRDWRSLGWIASALVVMLLTVAVELPAAWVAPAVNGAMRGAGIGLVDVQGSLWQGDGLIALSPAAGRDASSGGERFSLPGRLRWNISPASLFSGRIEARISHPALAHDLVATRGLFDAGGATTIDAGQARLDAQALVALGAPFNTLKPEGQLRFAWDTLAATREGIRGGVTIEWLQAASVLSPIKPLGSYRLVLSAAGGAADLVLTTLNDPLTLEGRGRMTAASGLQFNGIASADAAMLGQLNGLLSVLGRRDGDRAILRFGT